MSRKKCLGLSGEIPPVLTAVSPAILRLVLVVLSKAVQIRILRRALASDFHIISTQTTQGGRSYNRSGSKKGKPAKIPNGPFMKDVILLGGPEDNRVPRQGSRVWLMENGHVICGAQFMKEWDAKTLQDFFKSLFPSLGEFDDDVEVLMSVHSRLMAPVLAPGQVLTGFMVQKVFKDKPIYIRPSRHILDMEPLFKKAKLDSEVSS